MINSLHTSFIQWNKALTINKKIIAILLLSIPSLYGMEPTTGWAYDTKTKTRISFEEEYAKFYANALAGKTDEVEQQLQNILFEFYHFNHDHAMLLHRTSEYNDATLTNHLIFNAGCKQFINHPGPYLEWTPLHYAVDYGCFKTVKALVKSGADIHKTSKFNQTPLDLASLRISQRPYLATLIEKQKILKKYLSIINYLSNHILQSRTRAK